MERFELGKEAAWRTIRWREGSADWLSARFARVRVRVVADGAIPGQVAEEWLLIERPEGVTRPAEYKYWLATLPADIDFRRLVDIAKMRWRIERDYQELEQEVGLGHYEGRGWRGFHHHATLCIAAYARQSIRQEGTRDAVGFAHPTADRGRLAPAPDHAVRIVVRNFSTSPRR